MHCSVSTVDGISPQFLKRVTIITVGFALAFSGCGAAKKSSSVRAAVDHSAPSITAASASTTPDCKTLVTVDEAGALFGEPATEPSGGLNSTGDSESFCDWEISAKSDFSGFTLLQLQTFNDVKYVPEGSYDPSAVHDVTIPGTTEAFSINDKPNESAVNFATKGKRVLLTFTPADKNGAAHLNQVVALAMSVAARIN